MKKMKLLDTWTYTKYAIRMRTFLSWIRFCFRERKKDLMNVMHFQSTFIISFWSFLFHEISWFFPFFCTIQNNVGRLIGLFCFFVFDLVLKHFFPSICIKFRPLFQTNIGFLLGNSFFPLKWLKCRKSKIGSFRWIDSKMM